MNIRALFPTPIGQVSNFINEDERLKLFKDITSVKHESHGAIVGNGVSSHSSDRVQDFPSFIDKNIKNRLTYQVNQYAMRYGIGSNLEVSNIWSNIQNSGSVLNEHCHPNSLISGALYLNVNDSCYLTFHNPNPYIYFTDFVEDNPCNFKWQRFFVKNGDLILFPSWLKHGHHSDVNTMDNRMVISFNTNYDK